MKSNVFHSRRNQRLLSQTLGIAVVGCGYWGMNYVRIFSNYRYTCRCRVCQRPDLQEVARRFPGVYLSSQVNDAHRSRA